MFQTTNQQDFGCLCMAGLMDVTPSQILTRLAAPIIYHPPFITIDSWYKPFPVMGGLLLLYPNYFTLFLLDDHLMISLFYHGKVSI